MRRRRYRMPCVALLIAAGIMLVDQVIKFVIINTLKPFGNVAVINGLFNLTYVENRGVAFGIFQDMRWVFVIVTSIMLFLMIFYMFRKRPKGKLFYICAGLIIGGGVGNLIDRLIHGYVVDYLALSFFPPVCNFADYCITIGVILLVIHIIFFSDMLKSSKEYEEKDD